MWERSGCAGGGMWSAFGTLPVGISCPCFLFELTSSLGFPCGSAGKEYACSTGDLGSIPGWEDPLEKGEAAHSSILAWRSPWTAHEESQRVGHD